MGYVIEVFQSRFPNVITDPNLSGFFPEVAWMEQIRNAGRIHGNR